MANVFFKRGTLSSLNNQPINDGTIYITTDERAMYVDIGENQRIRLGDFVECTDLAAVMAISNPNPHSLYYANSENILAKWDATRRTWAQVNGQVAINNLISSINQSARTVNNVTTLVTSILDNHNGSVSGKTTYASANTDLLKIAGSTTTDNETQEVIGNITITPANLKESTSLSTEAINGGVKINVINKQTGTDASGNTVNTSETSTNPINLIASTGLTISRDENTGNIVFTGQGAYTEFTSNFSSNGSLNLVLTDSVGNSLYPETLARPIITYGKTSTLDAVFASGTAVLDVYTSGQVDTLISNQLKALDAMTFRGTLGSAIGATVSALPTTNVQNGDTYKVITANTYNNQSCRVGDMFIAAGVETDGYLTEPINWTYIPSGSDASNDFSFTYNDTTQIITFNDNYGVLTTFKAGTNIAFSNGVSENDIVIAHKTVERTNTNGTAITQTNGTNLTFNAVTGITSDSTGHITEVVTTPITVKDTHNNILDFEVTKVARNGGVTSSIKLTDSTGDHVATDTIQSSSLDLSVTDNKTVIDLVWGTF